MENKGKKIYAIFSGEGDTGTWETTAPLTELGLKRRLTKERQGGDRWARAYALVSPGWPNVGTDPETGEARELPGHIVAAMRAN